MYLFICIHTLQSLYDLGDSHMQWDISWNISIVGDISNFLGSHMRDISKVYDFWPEISPVYEISHQISPMWESPNSTFNAPQNMYVYVFSVKN